MFEWQLWKRKWLMKFLGITARNVYILPSFKPVQMWHISSREYEGSDVGPMNSTSGDDGIDEPFGLDPCQAVALDSRTWLCMLIGHNSRNPDKSKKIIISA